ncbi:unnamed protein product [Paramecium sonneborni]|uniref:Transmembrane protein n=1 Tax=Paramecium sonneborni TaxID=65129 RepID=A0A8S1Q737_9CILI|nr:unnamed protein product [Paramecium sonneborni]
MLQIIKSILIASAMYLTSPKAIYPTFNSVQNTQWEDNLWLNCQTKANIVPFKCQEGELNWQECYQVPKEGLCLIKDIETSFQGNLIFNITFNSPAIGQQVEIEINKNNLKQQLTTNSFWIQQEIDSSSISLKILTFGLVLSEISISSDCSLNCQECHSDNTCKNCLQDYFLFNYRCVPLKCVDQISQLTFGSHISSSSEIELNTTNLLITSNFNIPLNGCLIPKVYLTKSIEDNTITTILKKEQVSLHESDNKILKYYLTPEQFQSCQNIQTAEKIVYQCFIGFSISMNKVSQYLLMLISQVEVLKSTQSYTNSIQIFEMPTSNNEPFIVGPIIIFSDSSSTVIDTNNKLVQTSQNIMDPNYQNYESTFLNGSITQNSTSIPLKLEDQQQSGSTIQLILSYDQNAFNQNQSYNITISSSLQQNSRRRLLGERNIIPKLEIKNNFDSNKVQYSTVYLPSNDSQQSSLKGGYLALIFIAVIIFSFLFIIATIVLIQKVENKYFQIKQINDKKDTNDPQNS